MSLFPPTAADGTPLTPPQADTPEVRTSAPGPTESPEPPYGYADDCTCPACVDFRNRLSAWEARRGGRSAPAAETAKCDCLRCRMVKALKDAFPNAKADPLGAFAAAPGPLSLTPPPAETVASSQALAAARIVRDLRDGPRSAEAAFGPPRNVHERLLMDAVEDGLAEACGGLTAAAGAISQLVSFLRLLDASGFEQAAERR